MAASSATARGGRGAANDRAQRRMRSTSGMVRTSGGESNRPHRARATRRCVPRCECPGEGGTGEETPKRAGKAANHFRIALPVGQFILVEVRPLSNFLRRTGNLAVGEGGGGPAAAAAAVVPVNPAGGIPV